MPDASGSQNINSSRKTQKPIHNNIGERNFISSNALRAYTRIGQKTYQGLYLKEIMPKLKDNVGK